MHEMNYCKETSGMKRSFCKLFFLTFSLFICDEAFSQFVWTSYAKHLSDSRGLTFTRDGYVYSVAGAGTLAGNTMSAKVSYIGATKPADDINYSFSCPSGAASQIHISTEYFSTGALDPCNYYCPPLQDPGLVTTGLWLGADWPNKTSDIDVDMTFTFPVYSATFDIYDINQNAVSAPFSDLVVISAVTCSGVTVYPATVTNLDPPYVYTSATGVIAPSNNTVGLGTLFSTVTFANVGLSSIKITYKSNSTLPPPNIADPDYQFIIVKEINGTFTATPLTLTASAATLCAGSSATLTAGSGFSSYVWNPGGSTTQAITITPSTGSSTYTVIASNVSGCTVAATTTVTVLPFPAATVSGTTVCAGDMATLTASGGGSYSWSTGQTSNSITVSPTANTTYSVIVSVGSCVDTAAATVWVISGVTANISSANTTLCSGNSTTLTATGGGSYAWNPGGQTTNSIVVSPSATTTYSVLVSNGSCAAATTVTVYVISGVTPSIAGSVNICAGSSATLAATGASSYLWSNGSTATAVTVSPTASAVYTVTATNANGCTGVATTTVNVSPLPVASVQGATICAGAIVTLTGTGGNTYSWNTGNTTASIVVSPTITSSYTVVVSNGACSDTAITTVTIVSFIAATAGPNNTICAGQSASLSATGGGNYAWSNGATTASIIVSPVTSANYSVLVTSGSCWDTANASVIVIPNPIAGAYSTVTILAGQSTTLGALGGGSYLWSDGSTTSTITVAPIATTQYCVMVSNSFGCSDTACVTVFVEPIDCSFSSVGEFFIPNAFSPNGDQENDILQLLYGNYSCIKTYKFIIYNRWGEQVFTTEDPKGAWDGWMKEKTENSSIFAYYMKATLLNGQQVIKKGNISLIK